MSKQPTLKQLQPYAQSKLDISGSCVVCSIAYVVNSKLAQEGKQQTSIEQFLQLALQHKFFSSQGNGIHSKGSANLGKLFGKVEWGFFGNNEDELSNDEIDPECRKRQFFDCEKESYTDGPELIREKLREDGLLVVGVRSCMSSMSRATTHAVVVIGIDDSNRVTIADSYSHFTKRKEPNSVFKYGKPIWEFSPGIYTVEWSEFDASWNSRDDYEGDDDIEDDEAFADFNISEEGFRFWMAIKVDSKIVEQLKM